LRFRTYPRNHPGTACDTSSACTAIFPHVEEPLLLAAAVKLTVVAGENLTVGSTVWLPAEGMAPGR